MGKANLLKNAATEKQCQVVSLRFIATELFFQIKKILKFFSTLAGSLYRLSEIQMLKILSAAHPKTGPLAAHYIFSVCILPSASGSHSVCVCAIYKKSLQLAILLTTIVCDITDKNCMIHCCAECPGKTTPICKSSNNIAFQHQVILYFSNGSPLTELGWTPSQNLLKKFLSQVMKRWKSLWSCL